VNNILWFIAQRISDSKGSRFSSLITRIAIGSVAVGLAAMMLSFMIFRGFREEIQDKIFSFAAHFTVSKFNISNSVEGAPLPTQTKLAQQPGTVPNVARLQLVSKKAALLKTDEEVMGVVLKGVGPDYDSLRFGRNLVAGRFLAFPDTAVHSNDLVISQKIANKLKLKLNDDVIVYFIQDPPRARRLRVCGVYETGLEDFDNQVVIGDNRLVQRLNNWGDSLTGSYEILLQDFGQLPETADEIVEQMDYNMQLQAVTDQYVHFFDWFLMLNRNVVIFLSIILFVACFNTISILLILIMERTHMIGMLKALGATNAQVRQVFVFRGIRILLLGMAWGNGLALGFGLLQHHFRLIPLDAETYYMNAVPIAWDWPTLLGLNVLMFGLVSAILLLPTAIIARITPIKAIRFD
jgi:lipoprotein-releasing system permease protein